MSNPEDQVPEPDEGREPVDGTADEAKGAGDQSAPQPAGDAIDEAIAEILDAADAAAATEGAPASEVDQLNALVAERTSDLQRLHAEYANYKKRVDRDRSLSRAAGIESVVLDLLPVLDSVEAAREHSELVGGFKLVAEELEKITAKYGLEAFGEVGEPFDPQIHEALMQMPMAGDFEVPTVSAVMQRGVKLNGRVIRPARVGVADPDQPVD